MDQWVEQYITSHPYKFIKYLKKPKKIDTTVTIMGMRPKKEPWSQYEIQFLVDHWSFKKPEWLAKALKRTQVSVVAMAGLLRKKGYHLPKKRNTNGRITED